MNNRTQKQLEDIASKDIDNTQFRLKIAKNLPTVSKHKNIKKRYDSRIPHFEDIENKQKAYDEFGGGFLPQTSAVLRVKSQVTIF